MLNLGYDMFDELKHNMNIADAFANRINCTRLGKITGRDVEAVNDIRFVLDESEVKVRVAYGYSDINDANAEIWEATATFEMNDDMEFVFNPTV